MVQMYIVYFEIQPRSGVPPFEIVASGYLSSDPNIPSTLPEANDEVVRLKVFNGLEWVDANAMDVTRIRLDDYGYLLGTGYFEIHFVVQPGWNPGTWPMRVNYPGNSAKGLTGCKK